MESRRTGTHNLAGRSPGWSNARGAGQPVGGRLHGDRGEGVVDESAGRATASTPRWRGEGRGPPARSRPPACGWRIRTGHVLDPRGGLLLCPRSSSASAARRRRRPVRLLDPRRDEVGILLWALDNEGVSGAVNATAPNPATNRESPRRSAAPSAAPRSPRTGLRLDLKYGTEFGPVLRGGQRAVPQRALDLGYRFRHPDLDEALGTSFRLASEGASRTDCRSEPAVLGFSDRIEKLRHCGFA